jgi:DNA-binding helix-hairpin-helix protein with protein kinase domain
VTVGTLVGIGILITVVALFKGALPVAGLAAIGTALTYAWTVYLDKKKGEAWAIYQAAKARHDEDQRRFQEQSRAYESEKRGRQMAVDSRIRDLDAVFRETARLQTEYQQKFHQMKAELEGRYRRYLNLDSDHKADLRALEQRKQQLQLNEFLDKKLIRNHRIRGIGPQKQATLLAYGVESALDVKSHMAVPGIGPHLTSVLMAWRTRCEAAFRFNPSAPLPSGELAALRLKYAQLRQSIESDLRGGPAALCELSVSAKRHIENAEARIPHLVQQYAQAVADLSVFS